MLAAAESTTHIVPMPRWGSVVGVARFALAILVLAFTAGATAIWGGGFTAFGFTLFTASATLIIFAYYIVALSRKPVLYSCWAVLGLEIFGVVFWLVSFALCASWTATYNGDDYWFAGEETYGFWNAPFKPEDIGLQTKSVEHENNKYHTGVALAGIAAGLGAVEFVLFAVTLVFFSINLRKHRLAGNPTIYGGPTTARETETTTAEKESDEAEANEDTTPQILERDSSAVV